MKLEEKLMKLRKRNAWSQEEFADKLNVSRQTVSKWELGQTTPDTDNLSKIATIFGVTVNDLLDENINPIEEKTNTINNSGSNSENNSRTIKIAILIIILIVAFLGIGTIIINKIFNKNKTEEQATSIINTVKDNIIPDIFNKVSEKIDESDKESDNLNKELFNHEFKSLYFGSVDGFFMNNFIDAVIKSNEENPNNIITVNFEELETSDASELREMKKKFNKTTTYEISYEYDDNGLIKKAKIEDFGGENGYNNIDNSHFNSFSNYFNNSQVQQNN